METSFKLKILTPDGILFSDSARQVTARNSTGEFGVLPGHTVFASDIVSGKMDIISSLATLSYDERRSEFFTKELLILLRLVDQKIIDRNILYGSWAGAFGNFQFMPRTIRNYAIEYNKNKTN